jgi:hypothetical protein
MQSLAVVALATIFLAPAPAPEEKPEAKDAAKPVLIVKHKDCLIHAIPQPIPVTALREMEGAHMLLVHTSTATGDMKRLLASGQSSVTSPHMNIDRIYYTRTNIVAVTADAERLYVVWHKTKDTVLMVLGEGRDRPTFKPGTFSLIVFRIADGEKLHTLEMKEGDFPDKMPTDSSDPGPLKLIEGGVTCYGVTFEFTGKEVKQHYDKKKD